MAISSSGRDSLRDYQRQAVEAVEHRLLEARKVSLVMPHGTGKSRVLTEITRRFSERLPTLIIVGNLAVANQLLYLYQEVFGDKFARIFAGSEVDDTLSSAARENAYYPVEIINSQRFGSTLKFYGSYELVVIFDVKLSASLQRELMSGKFASAKQIFIESLKSLKYEEFAGPPVFEYTLKQAVSEEYLRSIEYRVVEKVKLARFDDVDNVYQMFGGIIEKISESRIAKVLVVCGTTEDAEDLYATLLKIPALGRPILMYSGGRSVNERVKTFANESEKSIAIVVNFFIGIDFPELTDLVLLRRFANERDFLQAISHANRLGVNLDAGRVWDFSGNQIYFNSDLGRIINIQINDSNKESVSAPATKSGDLVTPLEDKPAKVDLLGRKGLVDILKGLIERDTKDHLIIALFGHWGSGKSSVIQMLRDKYDKATDRNFTEFNAWQAEHSNSMSASIAQQLVNDLYGSESILDQITLSFKARLLQSKSSLLIEFTVFAVITAFCFGYVFPEWWKSLAVGNGMLAALTLSLPALFTSVSSYLRHPFTGQLRELARRPNFKEHIGLGHAIREQIFCLLSVHPLSFWQVVQKAFGKTVQKEHKYILAIDDLDRCSDKKIIETLEAIQLIVDLPSVNILLAVAPDILLDAVASRYKQQRQGLSDENAKHLARDFLGKVLQITITLDKPTSLNRNHFINTRLYSDVEKSIKAAPDPLPKIDLETNKKQESEEILDFTGFVDEDDQDYDRTESYLKSSNDEYEFFVKCSEYFDIHNPRTLIRIHNAVTLLKGVYPAIYQSDGMLNHYIYLTFWHEIYATVDVAQKKVMLSIILPESTDVSARKTAVNDQLISFENLNHNEIKTVLFRVKNMSLPAIELG